LVVGIHDLGPGGSGSIVAAVEPVGAVDGPDQEDGRMRLTGRSLAEPHGSHGLIHIREGRHAGTPVGEAVERVISGNPEFPGHPEDGSRKDPLPVAVGVSPGNRDGIHLREGFSVVGAPIDRHAVAIDPLHGIGGVEGGGIRPVGCDGRAAGKPGTGRPATAQGRGIGRGPIAAVRGHHHHGTVGGHRH